MLNIFNIALTQYTYEDADLDLKLSEELVASLREVKVIFHLQHLIFCVYKHFYKL